MKIEFTAEGHTYTVDGRPTPSVTTVLGAVGMGPSWRSEALERAARRGTYVHQAVTWYERGELDEVDPIIARYLEAWKAAKKALQITPVVVEWFVASDNPLPYAGRLDMLVRMPIWSAGLGIIDIKTGKPNKQRDRLQIAAYRAALISMGIYVQNGIPLYLDPDSTPPWDIDPIPPHEILRLERVWGNCLVLYEYLKG